MNRIMPKGPDTCADRGHPDVDEPACCDFCDRRLCGECKMMDGEDWLCLPGYGCASDIEEMVRP